MDDEVAVIADLAERAGLAAGGRKRRVQDAVARLRSRDGLPVGSVPGGVDVGERGRLEAVLLHHVGKGAAAGQRVVDLVGDIGDAVAGVVARDLGPELVLDLIEGLRLRRLDAVELQDVPAEGALERRRGVALFKRERGIGKLRRQVGLADPAEIERAGIVGLGDRLGHRGEILAGNELGLRLLGRRLVAEQHLLDMTLLGHVEFVLAALIFLRELVVRHLDAGGHVVEQQRRHRDGAPFRCFERVLVRVIVLADLAFARGGDGAGGAGRQQHEVGDAMLVARAIERVHQFLGRRHAAGQRVDELRPQDVGTHLRLELRLGQVVGGEDLGVDVADRTGRPDPGTPGCRRWRRAPPDRRWPGPDG